MFLDLITSCHSLSRNVTFRRRRFCCSRVRLGRAELNADGRSTSPSPARLVVQINSPRIRRGRKLRSPMRLQNWYSPIGWCGLTFQSQSSATATTLETVSQVSEAIDSTGVNPICETASSNDPIQRLPNSRFVVSQLISMLDRSRDMKQEIVPETAQSR